eukprot:m.10672 g.10672  ORF g.10672 m.10672 type:complete len:63 (-) comp6033_c0_seq1:193-381(-)
MDAQYGQIAMLMKQLQQDMAGLRQAHGRTLTHNAAVCNYVQSQDTAQREIQTVVTGRLPSKQ